MGNPQCTTALASPIRNWDYDLVGISFMVTLTMSEGFWTLKWTVINRQRDCFWLSGCSSVLIHKHPIRENGTVPKREKKGKLSTERKWEKISLVSSESDLIIWFSSFFKKTFFPFCVNKLIGSIYFIKFEIIICKREEHEIDVFAGFVCQACFGEGERKYYIGQGLGKMRIIIITTKECH